jgi:hypothetical protein
MIAIIFLIIATIFVYRTARDNGYNAILWAVITVITFLGVQLAVGFLIGIIFGLGMAAFGWSETSLTNNAFVFNLIALAASIGSVMLILRHVNKIPDDEPANVPPPPKFDEKL